MFGHIVIPSFIISKLHNAFSFQLLQLHSHILSATNSMLILAQLNKTAYKKSQYTKMKVISTQRDDGSFGRMKIKT